MSAPVDVTLLLAEMQAGSREAADQLIRVIYDELRRVAARCMRRERANHTLQPTALVHEAYFRLVAQRHVRWQNRAHFLGIAATAMRRILVDHSRRKRAAKRDGGVEVTLGRGLAAPGVDSLDLLELDAALRRLAELDERAARVIELRFFGGLSVEETAEVLGVATATVKRDWRHARAWLRRELGAPADSGAG